MKEYCQSLLASTKLTPGELKDMRRLAAVVATLPEGPGQRAAVAVESRGSQHPALS